MNPTPAEKLARRIIEVNTNKYFAANLDESLIYALAYTYMREGEIKNRTFNKVVNFFFASVGLLLVILTIVTIAMTW
jgi:hypothetical protein